MPMSTLIIMEAYIAEKHPVTRLRYSHKARA
jgi:hypothetical protein